MLSYYRTNRKTGTSKRKYSRFRSKIRKNISEHILNAMSKKKLALFIQTGYSWLIVKTMKV